MSEGKATGKGNGKVKGNGKGRGKGNGKAKAKLALVGYVIIPLVIKFRLLTLYPELPREMIIQMMYASAIIGSILVLLALASTRYPRGSMGRLFFNLTFDAFVIVWFMGILGWSTTIVTTYDGYEFTLYFFRYLVLLIVVAIINGIYHIAETVHHRPEFKGKRTPNPY